MSRRRRLRWFAPPGPLALGVIVGLSVVAGCSGARPTTTAGAWGTAGPLVRGTLAKHVGPIRTPPGLAGKTWLAEGPRGWEAGTIGGRRVVLGKAEVGLAASDRWILSAILRPVDSITLLVRDGPGAAPKALALGRLAPTAIAVSGDRAFVSGFLFGTTDDPGILEIDLQAAVAQPLLEPSGAAGSRYLAVSPDGSTLVSSLCDLASGAEPATCELTRILLADGSASVVGPVPGGLLRGTSSDVAVVAEQGPEAPGWVAGIDLLTGSELWRVAGGEFGPSVVSREHGLVQQRLFAGGGPKPRLAIESVDLRTGARRTIYEESRLVLRSFWPALSSDAQIAIGDDATGRRAIGADGDAHTHLRLIPIDGGVPVDVELSLGSEP